MTSSRTGPSTASDSKVTHLCFRAPGGQIGIPRLRGLVDLLRSIDDPTVMITRRQALVVRGGFQDVPDYLHRELESQAIRIPNVKSYPIPFQTKSIGRMVRSLNGVLRSHEHNLKLSVSLSSRYRGELRRDDLCIAVDRDSIRLESNLWTDQPFTIIDDVPGDRWPGIVEGIDQLLEGDDFRDRNPRSTKRLFTRAINQSDPADTVIPATPGIDEQRILGDSLERFPAYTPKNSDRRWLMVTVPAGILSLSDLTTLLEGLRTTRANELILTPEQNIIIPLGVDDLETVRSTLVNHTEDPHLGTPFRIATCPGARFCANADLQPVEMVRHLLEKFAASTTLSTFNRTHPIGVTGCGETRALERLHPVGLAPNHDRSGYDVFMGGQLRGNGRKGKRVETAVPSERVHDRLEDHVTDFHESEAESLWEWIEQAG